MAQITESVRWGGLGRCNVSHSSVLPDSQSTRGAAASASSFPQNDHHTRQSFVIPPGVCSAECFLHRTFTFSDHWLSSICGLHVCGDWIRHGRCTNHFGLAAHNELGHLVQAETTAEWSWGRPSLRRPLKHTPHLK